jgi:hypothetical protein
MRLVLPNLSGDRYRHPSTVQLSAAFSEVDQVTCEPADRVWFERVARHNLFLDVTASQAFKRPMLKAFRPGSDIHR